VYNHCTCCHEGIPASVGSEIFCEVLIQPKQIKFAMIFIKTECRLTCAGFYWLKSVLYFNKVRQVRTGLSFKIESGLSGRQEPVLNQKRRIARKI
jgi:hypothetical protein